MKGSQLRLRTKQMTSHFEGYLGAIQDQEIATKYLKRKRQIDSGQQPTMNNKCHLCKSSVEDVNHVISSCPKMSARYYLPLRHDALDQNFAQPLCLILLSVATSILIHELTLRRYFAYVVSMVALEFLYA